MKPITAVEDVGEQETLPPELLRWERKQQR